MKTITSIIAIVLLLSSGIAKGTIITVSNNPVGAGQYSDLQTAINAAAVGDTLYVMASPLVYDAGGITISKRVIIIGAGYVGTGTQTNMSTMVGEIILDSTTVGTPVAGTQIIGVDATNGINAYYNVNDILVARCYCTYINTTDGSGWVIEDNIVTQAINFYGGASNVFTNCMVRNNFLIGGLYANGLMIASGVVVDHNIIEGYISTVNYLLVTNNIFFYADISGSPNNSYNVYNNNITVYGPTDNLPFGATNTGSNNQNNVAPASVFNNGLTAAVGWPNVLTYDWHLVSGSPGHNAALDGTDIGIYGGTTPMNFTGASTLPQMTLLNIKGTAVPVNGTVNYEFKARIQN